jgi:hypothetical protein
MKRHNHRQYKDTCIRILGKHLLAEGCNKSGDLEDEKGYEEKDVGMAAHAFAVTAFIGYDERGSCGGESDTAASADFWGDYDGFEPPFYGM